MRKGLTELVFILDRSGSMGGMESDVIGGFNSVIERQRNLEGEVLVSTILFDNETEILHDREDIDFVEPLTEDEYYTRGSTALLDAVGGAIKHISRIHKYAREEDRPEHVMFFINTDGYENSSRKYSYDKIKTMIDIEKEKYDWEFVFMGANIDAFDVADRMGIFYYGPDKTRTASWNKKVYIFLHSHKLFCYFPVGGFYKQNCIFTNIA